MPVTIGDDLVSQFGTDGIEESVDKVSRATAPIAPSLFNTAKIRWRESPYWRRPTALPKSLNRNAWHRVIIVRLSPHATMPLQPIRTWRENLRVLPLLTALVIVVIFVGGIAFLVERLKRVDAEKH